MAIEAVENFAKEMKSSNEGDLTVYHAIVHNNTVIERLEDQHGVSFIEDLNEFETLRQKAEQENRKLSDTVVFSAHGISPAVREQAKKLDFPP